MTRRGNQYRGRGFVAALAACALLGATAPAGASVIGEAAGYQLAISVWLDEQGAETVLYFAVGVRGSVVDLARTPEFHPEDVTGLGGVGRGVCRNRGGERVCKAKATPYQLDPTTFVFDPALGTATMSIPEEEHEILWTGRRQAADPEYGFGGSTNWASVYLNLVRKATIEGRAFGDRFQRQSPSFSYLLEGTDAFAVANRLTGLRIDRHGRFVVTIRETY